MQDTFPVIYCCVTNHPKLNGLEQQQSFYYLCINWEGHSWLLPAQGVSCSYGQTVMVLEKLVAGPASLSRSLTVSPGGHWARARLGFLMTQWTWGTWVASPEIWSRSSNDLCRSHTTFYNLALEVSGCQSDHGYRSTQMPEKGAFLTVSLCKKTVGEGK